MQVCCVPTYLSFPWLQLAASRGCSQQQVDAVRALAAGSSSSGGTTSASGAALYQRQHLFSIYVHSPPEYEAYAKDR